MSKTVYVIERGGPVDGGRVEYVFFDKKLAKQTFDELCANAILESYEQYEWEINRYYDEGGYGDLIRKDFSTIEEYMEKYVGTFENKLKEEYTIGDNYVTYCYSYEYISVKIFKNVK